MFLPRSFSRLGWILPVVILLGCGPSRPRTVVVSGTVTYKKVPVQGASILFAPKGKGNPALATTDVDGKYRLRTFAQGDGAIPGDYVVSITACIREAAATGAARPAKPPKITWLIPEKYASVRTSGLTATVAPGQQEFNFDLD
jgi:hypothetical protein